jgi:zinc transport system ATP-binding protein
MSEPAVRIERLSVGFDGHTVLSDIDLEIPAGKFVAVVGPNGAGKSTFLRILLGLIKPDQGIIKLFGRDLNKVPADWIGYVPQVKTMDRSFPALAVELVLTGVLNAWPWGRNKTLRERAHRALKQVGAAHLENRPLAALSGGELQRICLARSIVREPRLVLLDEPATGIDSVGEADMYDLLEQYQERSEATILMITHDWHAATNHADLVLLLNQKQISFGPPREALSEYNLRRAFGHIGHNHKLKFPAS